MLLAGPIDTDCFHRWGSGVVNEDSGRESQTTHPIWMRLGRRPAVTEASMGLIKGVGYPVMRSGLVDQG